jgi:sterol 3beta-glucosyltransferase
MRFVLAALGTRGDSDPLIALSMQLQCRGHEVVFITHEDHESQARAFGINFHKVDGNLKASSEGLKNLNLWTGKAALKKWHETFFVPFYRRMLDAIWEQVQRADALILGGPGLISAQRAGQIRNIPTFIACSFPALSPTRYFPHLIGPQLNLGPLFNRLSYSLNRLYPADWYRVIAAWHRETLGVGPPARYENYLKADGRRLPVLYCYSEALFPSPPDWDDTVCVSGFWLLPEDPTWKPPPALLDFLHGGSPPICISFSSLIGLHPEKSMAVVNAAIRRLPYRVLVCGGWGGLCDANLPGNAFFIRSAPFQWLFRYVGLVVHHGGAGTTATAIRAGKPAVICPALGDQPFWARVAHKKGVAPPSRMHHRLTADWLVYAIRLVSSTPSMARSAMELGQRLQQEDSFGKAIQFIDRQVEVWRKQRPASQVRRSPVEQRT